MLVRILRNSKHILYFNVSAKNLTAEITYQYNEQNYPTRAEIDYYDEYGLEYAYFEYESY